MTVTTFDPNADAVTMTAAAVKHFERALAGKEDQLVRLSTKESGCSGFAYELDLVAEAQTTDVVLTPHEHVTLAVAADAIDILRGTEIDMVTEGVNTVVKFNNPNVVAECGCGESFSVN
ncbi:MAG: iron-sulfur cluster assembly accessory protein [Pseudomonadales bacterium]|nr:iron-sulfur cluster assembly accessory protein [Pseudomonadales bacterium]